MSYYQQQYYSPTAQPMSGAPVSSFYAARQRFEQPATPVSPQTRSNTYDYRQYSAPPKHPVQQARQAATQQNQQHYPGRPGLGQPQMQTQAQQQFGRSQSQYGQVQHTYQSPYAQVEQQGYAQPQVQPLYGRSPQLAARPQSMYGYSPFPMLPGGQPTPAQAFALYDAYNARTQRAAAVTQPQAPPPPQPQVQHQSQTQHHPQFQNQQQAQVSSYVSTFGQQGHFRQYPVSPQQEAPQQQNIPSNSTASIPSPPQPPSQPPQRAPTVGGRRPLPQPGQSRSRPVSMPPRTQYQGPSFQVNGLGHAASSSVSSIMPQSSFQPGPLPPPSLRPSSPLLMQPSTPSAASSSVVLPPSSEISPPSNIQSIGNVRVHGQSPSSSMPNVLPESSFGPAPVPSPSLQHSSPPIIRSCSPSIPSSVLPPPSSIISSTPNVRHERSQSPEKPSTHVEAIVERTPMQRRALPQSPTAPPDLSQLQRHRSGISTGSPAIQPLNLVASASASPQIIPQCSLAQPQANSEKTEDDRSSIVSQESKKSSEITASPQYGILDLPKRNSQVFTGKPDPPSPQYGIKDLPIRTKSVVDRRKAWERVEQGTDEAAARPRSKLVSSARKATASAPVDKSHPPAKLVPPRSPQPQVPQQQQKLPMPVVLQPQPSRSERTPSWTLPTADLDKITTAGEKRSSVALRMAQMSLDEEKANSKRMSTQSTTSQARVQRPATQNSSKTSTSRSGSPTKSYPSSTRTPRRSVNIDINLDDAPPPSLRRSPSPSISTASSSVPSIPSIKTPDSIPQNVAPMLPKINLPGGIDLDDIPPKPLSPQKTSIPIINLPCDDDADSSGPVISVSAPSPKIRTDIVAMPVILNDLASSPSKTKSRGLPQPPSSTATSVSDASSSGSNSRSRGGGLVCGGCGRGILGRIVSAMGSRWHPQCFKCCQCGEQLEHVSSYEHDGKPYCHLDYHELFAPQCYSCKTPIIDERFITLDDPALGKRTYHEQHFFCAECGDPFLTPSLTKPSKRSGPNEISIKGDGAFDVAVDEDGLEVGFTVFRGHPYCEACHVRLRAPKCKGCTRSIRDGMRAVEALGGKWCYECFVCTGCKKPFEEPSFFQRGKMPFCEHCFSIILRNEI